MKTCVLVVEDEENLRLALCDNLEEEGYAVSSAATVAEAERLLARASFAVLVLDVMLPDGDGYALCKRLREAGRPVRVLMLTARSLEEDLVRGFDAGADDYLAKPYRLRELLARVRSLARREAPERGAEVLRFAGFVLDRTARTLHDERGQGIELTKTEFDLLACLVQSRGKALTRDQLLDAVWGPVVVDTHTVDNFVSSLKKKLGWTPRSPFAIRSVRGVGYRLDCQG